MIHFFLSFSLSEGIPTIFPPRCGTTYSRKYGVCNPLHFEWQYCRGSFGDEREIYCNFFFCSFLFYAVSIRKRDFKETLRNEWNEKFVNKRNNWKLKWIKIWKIKIIENLKKKNFKFNFFLFKRSTNTYCIQFVGRKDHHKMVVILDNYSKRKN